MLAKIIIVHQPGLPWNKGMSLPQLPFGSQVAIIWPESLLFVWRFLRVCTLQVNLVARPFTKLSFLLLNFQSALQTWGKFVDSSKCNKGWHSTIPLASMYGIFTYIWLVCMVNVGKHTIHTWIPNGYSTRWWRLFQSTITLTLPQANQSNDFCYQETETLKFRCIC